MSVLETQRCIPVHPVRIVSANRVQHEVRYPFFRRTFTSVVKAAFDLNASPPSRLEEKVPS